MFVFVPVKRSVLFRMCAISKSAVIHKNKGAQTGELDLVIRFEGETLAKMKVISKTFLAQIRRPFTIRL